MTTVHCLRRPPRPPPGSPCCRLARRPASSTAGGPPGKGGGLRGPSLANRSPPLPSPLSPRQAYARLDTCEISMSDYFENRLFRMFYLTTTKTFICYQTTRPFCAPPFPCPLPIPVPMVCRGSTCPPSTSLRMYADPFVRRQPSWTLDGFQSSDSTPTHNSAGRSITSTPFPPFPLFLYLYPRIWYFSRKF